MYKCKQCGNDKTFIERNSYLTTIVLENGKVIESNDDFEDCIEVSCYECGATSEDGDISIGYKDETICS